MGVKVALYVGIETEHQGVHRLIGVRIDGTCGNRFYAVFEEPTDPDEGLTGSNANSADGNDTMLHRSETDNN